MNGSQRTFKQIQDQNYWFQWCDNIFSSQGKLKYILPVESEWYKSRNSKSNASNISQIMFCGRLSRDISSSRGLCTMLQQPQDMNISKILDQWIWGSISLNKTTSRKNSSNSSWKTQTKAQVKRLKTKQIFMLRLNFYIIRNRKAVQLIEQINKRRWGYETACRKAKIGGGLNSELHTWSV